MEAFYFGLLGEWQEQEEPMILVGNVEKILADDRESARRHFEACHRLQIGWGENGKQRFEVVELLKE